MAQEQTNPGGVDLGVSEPTIEERMQAFVNREPALTEDDPATAPQEAAPQEQPKDPEQPDGLTVDDLPSEEAAPAAQSADEAFEITHNGQQVKLTRAELIKNAQQGFDYTQKTQELGRKRAEVDAVLQRAANVEQLTPFVAQDMAVVKQFEAQLQQYAKVNWVALASDPETVLDYNKHRAQYDLLLQGHQGAVTQLQQKMHAVNTERRNLTAYQLQQEHAVLVDRIPEWKDPEKYRAGAQELSSYLIGRGADPQEVAALSSSLAVQIARESMLYRKLIDAKTNKAKQLRTVPPVSKPGISPSSASVEKEQAARQRLSKTGSAADAAALLMYRMK